MKKAVFFLTLLTAFATSANAKNTSRCEVTIVPTLLKLKKSSEIIGDDNVRMIIEVYDRNGAFIETEEYWAGDEHRYGYPLDVGTPYRVMSDDSRAHHNIYFWRTDCANKIRVVFEEVDHPDPDDMILKSELLSLDKMTFEDAPELDYDRAADFKGKKFLDLSSQYLEARVKIIKRAYNSQIDDETGWIIVD